MPRTALEATQPAMQYFYELPVVLERLAVDDDLIDTFAALVGYADTTPQLTAPSVGHFTKQIDDLEKVLERICEALQNREETQSIVEIAQGLIASHTSKDISEIAQDIRTALAVPDIQNEHHRRTALNSARLLEDDAKKHQSRLPNKIQCLAEIANNPSMAYLAALDGFRRFGVGAVRANMNAR